MPQDCLRLRAEIVSASTRINDLTAEMHELIVVTRELIVQSRACMDAADQQLRGETLDAILPSTTAEPTLRPAP